MKDKLSRVLKSKSFYVVLSVLCGVLAWLFVLNYTNPVETRVEEIQITFLNEEAPAAAGLTNQTLTYAKTVTVTVSGRKDTINNLVKTELSATVDFAGITDVGKTRLKVNEPECSRLGIKIDDYYPKEIEFEFDKEVEKFLKVVVDYDNSLLKSGYEYINVKAEPESVQVSGVTSLVNELKFIRVNLSDYIDAGTVDDYKNGAFIGKYIKTNGEDATSQFPTEKITVTIEVAKRVKLNFQVQGTPHEDYYLESSGLSADSVLLQGSASDLRGIESINLGILNVSGVTEHAENKVNVSDYLPDGVTVYGNSMVTMSAEILKYEVKTFLIDPSVISMAGKDASKYNYEIRLVDDGTGGAMIKGKASDLKNLNIKALEPTLDVDKGKTGIFYVVLDFIKLDTVNSPVRKYTIMNQCLYEVIITEKPIETEPAPTASPSPSPETEPTEAPTTEPPVPTPAGEA